MGETDKPLRLGVVSKINERSRLSVGESDRPLRLDISESEKPSHPDHICTRPQIEPESAPAPSSQVNFSNQKEEEMARNLE